MLNFNISPNYNNATIKVELLKYESEKLKIINVFYKNHSFVFCVFRNYKLSLNLSKTLNVSCDNFLHKNIKNIINSLKNCKHRSHIHFKATK